jgi:uncharacterized protein (DUF697 family)
MLPSVHRCDRCSFISDEVMSIVGTRTQARRAAARVQGMVGIAAGFVSIAATLAFLTMGIGLDVGSYVVAPGFGLGIALGAWGARVLERAKFHYHLPDRDAAKAIEAEEEARRAQQRATKAVGVGVETCVAIPAVVES